MSNGPDQSSWPPLEQDWPVESQGKADMDNEPNEPVINPGDMLDKPQVWEVPKAKQVKREILDTAHERLSQALELTKEGLAWFSICEGNVGSGLIRELETILGRIEYRLDNHASQKV